MLKINKTIEKLVKSVRFCSTFKKETLLIQKTKYKTDEWTNINSRFEPFVGVNLYKRRNHPLNQTQTELFSFLKNWFEKNIDSNLELPIYRNLDPIEPNTSNEKLPIAFYVNKGLMLRTHAINREIKYLKSGIDNFVMLVDLYRRCQMDAKYFPVFHRMNIIRTVNSGASKDLQNEYQTLLIEMAKHFIGNDVKYRWTEANLASTDPSWIFEIFHVDEWHRISGCGLIRNDILEKSERINTTGWEIGIGLDRLAMILYKIFDVRLLWNSDQIFLKQFEPQKLSENLQAKINTKQLAGEKPSEHLSINRPPMQTKHTFKTKTNQKQMDISYILPQNVNLESFPTDELCKFIRMNTNNAAQLVKLIQIINNIDKKFD